MVNLQEILLVSRMPDQETSDFKGINGEKLTFANWPAYPYRPDVTFFIGHNDHGIFLKYIVSEKTIRAHTAEPNGQVWKDSCVEFFVSPADDGVYYNFELNCIGAIRLSAGQSRHGRTMASGDILQQMQVSTSLGRETFDEKVADGPWEITVYIPVTCFFQHPGIRLSGQTWRANFYKCGDVLSDPHFLSWRPIDTPQPDFHTPRFFGQIFFE